MSLSESSSWTYFFMIAGPTLAAILAAFLSFVLSISYQNRRRRIEAQQRIFEVLMAYRAAGFQPAELVNSLNLIDVIFLDKPRIIELWHNFYTLSSQQPLPGNEPLLHYAYLDMLSEIAKSLDYPLTQTDVARYYTPRAYSEPLQLDYQIRSELLRVLQDTARFVVDKKNGEAIS